jgi:hypothetical protein
MFVCINFRRDLKAIRVQRSSTLNGEISPFHQRWQFRMLKIRLAIVFECGQLYDTGWGRAHNADTDA